MTHKHDTPSHPHTPRLANPMCDSIARQFDPTVAKRAVDDARRARSRATRRRDSRFATVRRARRDAIFRPSRSSVGRHVSSRADGGVRTRVAATTVDAGRERGTRARERRRGTRARERRARGWGWMRGYRSGERGGRRARATTDARVRRRRCARTRLTRISPEGSRREGLVVES